MTDLTRHTIVRFAVVGVGVALIYVLLYVAFLGQGMQQPFANGLSFLLAVIVQYIAQTSWTFRRPLALPDQILRFICTIGLGLIVSALITGRLGPMLGLSDWMAAVIVTVVLPVQNFLFFRGWVFSTTRVSLER